VVGVRNARTWRRQVSHEVYKSHFYEDEEGSFMRSRAPRSDLRGVRSPQAAVFIACYVYIYIHIYIYIYIYIYIHSNKWRMD